MRKIYTLLLSFIIAFPLSAQVSHVVISQVYAGGGNSGASFNSDYVELFNPTPETINLDGWSIQYSSAGGSTWAARILAGSIDPGKYFLVKMSNDGLNGANISLPDMVVTPQLALATSGGEVALVKSLEALAPGCNKDSSVADLLGYGSAACSETAPAAAGSSSKSIHRINKGCADTDNNAGDFVTAAPVPRNSKAQASICGLPTALPASSLTPVSFVARWSAFAGADTYALDVLRDGSSMDPNTSLIAGWTFPLDGASSVADGSNTHNTSASIATNAGVITDAAGATTRSASANMWTDGAQEKYWQIKINATGHSNLKLSSQQRSSGTGPRDFVVQYRIGNTGNWAHLSGGSIVLTSDFAEGIFTDLSLPSNANNQPEVFIRWLMASNTSVNEDSVSNAGTSRIDNIYVRGNGTIAVEFVPGYESRAVADTSLQVTGLEPSKNYYYRVRAGYNGSVSGTSNTIQLTTPPMVPLAVQMINVKATRVEKGVLVTWSNPSESSILFYNVERSLSGETFKPFARKLPAHNRGDLATYELLDTVRAPQRFYRILAVEASGRESRSIVVGFKENIEGPLEVYPNPVRGQTITLTMSKAPAGQYELLLHNSYGQTVFSFKLSHGDEVTSRAISLPRLSSGSYLLRLLGPVQVQKWIIVQQ